MDDTFLIKDARKSLPGIEVEFFPQDPLVAKSNPKLDVVKEKLPGEACLGAGPTSSRVAVVDYNGDLDEILAPAQLLASGKGFKLGRKEPISNHAFHQVNVWAVITRAINLLEDSKVLGRRIPWAFGRGRLLVLPHAGYWENAYYDRESGGLHFFYFEGPGGKPVYTCLSHDIVTHELGHAVLDGLKPYYNEISSPATAGFHEYFGDAVALTCAMSHRRLMVETAGYAPLNLDAENFINGIAAEFGKALSVKAYGPMARDYLRTATNRFTMKDLEGVFEEHQYSEVLTGAYYDFLKKAYATRLKKKTAESGKARPDGGLRVGSLISGSQVTYRMFLRALDYCPPVDVDYLDYARAVMAADAVAYPIDGEGYRRMAADVFRRRRVCRRSSDLQSPWRLRNSMLRDLDVDEIASSKTDAYAFVDRNRNALGIPPTANLEIVHVYRTKKVSADEYRPPQETVVEFVWPEDVLIKGARFGEFRGTTMALWCGGTLVFNRDGNVLHYVLKPDSPGRRKTFLDYLAHLIKDRSISMDDEETGHGARARGANRFAGRVVDGRVRLRATPAFRHVGRPEVRDAR